MMMPLRPIRSESHPKKMKKGVPITNEVAISRYAVEKSLRLRALCRKNNAWNCPVYQTTPWPAVAPNRASQTYFAFGILKKLSRNGAVDPLPSDFISAKMGDSEVAAGYTQRSQGG